MKYLISEFKYIFNELVYQDSINEDFFYELKENGFIVIKNFLSKEKCGSLRKIIDEGIGKYDCQIDNERSDYRIFGIDRLAGSVKELFSNSLLDGLSKKYIDRNKLNSFIMANRVESKPNNLGSGGGWHRDSINRRQLKFIVYLSDVDDTRGNFQYLAKSHKIWVKLGNNRFLKKNLSECRYTNEDVAKLLENGAELKSLTGKMGTLIIADTSGIHRGKPIEQGVRYAMTNYMFDHDIPDHINTLLPN